MLGLGVNKLGVQNTSDPIGALFANGEQGAWYDISDLASLKQADGTTPAVLYTGGTVANENRVGFITDKSGNGNHAVQTNVDKCPILKSENGLYYLDFETAQGLRTSNTINFNGGDSLTVVAGVQKDINPPQAMVVAELSVNVGGNDGVFRLAAITGNIWRYSSKGDVVVNTNEAGLPDVSKNVVMGLSDISDDIVKLRIDGVEEASSSTDQGNGPLGTYQLNIGARNNASGLHLDGRIYSFVMRSVISSAAELATLESYMARKTGT